MITFCHPFICIPLVYSMTLYLNKWQHSNNKMKLNKIKQTNIDKNLPVIFTTQGAAAFELFINWFYSMASFIMFYANTALQRDSSFHTVQVCQRIAEPGTVTTMLSRAQDFGSGKWQCLHLCSSSRVLDASLDSSSYVILGGAKTIEILKLLGFRY